jgi:toxin ParE1/3/4
VIVHYTEAAEADLDEIATYTLIQWGEEQRDWYLRMLEHTCESIIPKNLRFGVARPVPKRSGLLRWHAEHHYVYFRRVRGGIEIVRILHERRDPEHPL